jgi:OmcA/MtrC family decaheme c-type cytochrome
MVVSTRGTNGCTSLGPVRPVGSFGSVALFSLFLVVAGLGLAGCGESSSSFNPGPTDSTDSSGTIGSGGNPFTQTLNIRITDVSGGSSPVVEFLAVDQNNYRYGHLTGASFTIAKLVPGQDGETPFWQSYINRTEIAGAGAWNQAPFNTPADASAIQAVGQDSSEGQFENLGNGRYRYTFTDLANVTAPVSVTWQPELTHRIGIQSTGRTVPAANAVYTYQPSTGATVGILDRRIVVQSTCNSCHGDNLALHDGKNSNGPGMHTGSSIDAKYCVTCHNPGSTDPRSGHSLDFRVMIHKIHMGRDLPRVPGGKPYTLWDKDKRPRDYSGLAFAQDQRNCTNCHNPALAVTPEAHLVETNPTRAACGSCHTTVNFATGEGHSAMNIPQASDQLCSTCHSTLSELSVRATHKIPSKEVSTKFQFNILDFEKTEEGARIRFSVTNPQNGRSYPIRQNSDLLRLVRIRVTWPERPSSEYRASTSRNETAIAIDGSLHPSLEEGPNGSYFITVALPRGNNAPRDPAYYSVAIEGNAWLNGREADVRARISGTSAFFNPDGTRNPGRRNIVSDAACQTCHEQYEGPFSGHDSARTDHIQLCVHCHNVNHFDASWQPWRGASNDLLQMVHGIHGNEVLTHEYRNRGYVRYPDRASNCAACHTGDSFHLTRMPANRPATQVAEDAFISPKAAACMSCHNSELARAHMQQNGGQIAVPAAQLLRDGDGHFPQESCAVCHGPGRVADVGSLHNVRNTR